MLNLYTTYEVSILEDYSFIPIGPDQYKLTGEKMSTQKLKLYYDENNIPYALREVGNNDVSFVRFTVDYLAEQQDGFCDICEKEISEGFLCLDDSSEYCTDCTEIVSLEGDK